MMDTPCCCKKNKKPCPFFMFKPMKYCLELFADNIWYAYAFLVGMSSNQSIWVQVIKKCKNLYKWNSLVTINMFYMNDISLYVMDSWHTTPFSFHTVYRRMRMFHDKSRQKTCISVPHKQVQTKHCTSQFPENNRPTIGKSVNRDNNCTYKFN